MGSFSILSDVHIDVMIVYCYKWSIIISTIIFNISLMYP